MRGHLVHAGNPRPHIVTGDDAPTRLVHIWPKDPGMVPEIAAMAGFRVPTTEAALAQFTHAGALRLGTEDDAAVAKVYARAAGLTLPGETA